MSNVPELRQFAISDNHRRAIWSTLALLDEALCSFDRFAAGSVTGGPLFKELDDLNDEQKRAIRAEVARLRDLLTTVKSAMELPPRTQDVSTSIRAACSCYWEYLVELESKRLRRYGQLPEGFGAAFDPVIKSLIERLDTISKIVSHRKEHEQRAEPCDDPEEG